MSEVSKAVGQWIVSNLGWTAVILLFVLSGIFKITKVEINPLGWIVGWIGKNLTRDVRKDVADFKKDYDGKIGTLKEDLDAFEKRTNKSIDEMKQKTTQNCELLKVRLDRMEESNDMQTIRQIKAHVLEFANSCMNKRKHTKRDFENIIDENAEYEKLVKKYGLVNDVYKEDFDFIIKCYHECQEKGSFLKESDIE